VTNRQRSQGNGASLRGLRDDGGTDQTLQNLLRALTLNLELRSRYRVFEFEANQDGHVETALLFNRLRGAENEQITELMAGLHAHLGTTEIVARSDEGQ
jgi:hypothetical protein